MKILTIETNWTGAFNDNDDTRWTPEMRAAFDEADVVLGLFSPHSTRVLKGPADLSVLDARERITQSGPRWVMLVGSTDPAACAAENAKLLRRS